MESDRLAQALADQVRRTLTICGEGLRAFPEDGWRSGDLGCLHPAGVAYHVVEAIDFYAGDLPANQPLWDGWFGADWETDCGTLSITWPKRASS